MKKEKNFSNYTIAAALCLLLIIILIKFITYYPSWIEENYSRCFYLVISRFYRSIFGFLPFSFGDILYAFAVFFIFYRVIHFVNIVRNNGWAIINWKKSLKKVFFIACSIYIIFNISWGLNYNRPGISHQFSLRLSTHSTPELKMINALLLKKVNENRLLLKSKTITIKPDRELFSKARDGFAAASAKFPFLRYDDISVKRSMYGKLGNFLGFLGYYNPFTGEAQVNLTQPAFLIPFVSCHEMAHQIGYASESEANFVGYIAAINSPDTLFHYSAYFDLFNYANRELFIKDSTAARTIYNQLDPLVKKDEEELKEYWRKSDNIIEPIIKIFYDRYLKANQQTKGVKSYNEVTGWLIAYYKKYGKI